MTGLGSPSPRLIRETPRIGYLCRSLGSTDAEHFEAPRVRGSTVPFSNGRVFAKGMEEPWNLVI
jgi:hypothetical protein